MEGTTDKLEEPLSKDQKEKLKSLLDEWYAHRVQLEAKLHGLAWELDAWERGTNTATAVGSFTGIGAGAAVVVGVIFPPLLLAGLALGGAAAATNITTSVVKEENLKKQVDAAVTLLEQDRQLTENFFNAVQKLNQTKIEVAMAPGREHMQPTSGHSLEEMLPAASAIVAAAARLGHERTFMPSRASSVSPTGIVKAVAAIGFAENIATAIRTIKNITKGSRSETANKLRLIADQLRTEAEEVRRLLNEELAAV